jgi:thiol-disulfide isomerase/thioredoxin
MHLRRQLALAVLTAWTAAAQGAESELGMTAPPLRVTSWLKGQPVSLPSQPSPGTDTASNSPTPAPIVVVEFWSTTCGSCRSSIPLLSSLQSRFRSQGVSIVGISREPAQRVTEYLRKNGDSIDYAIALDDNLRTSRAYLDAFHEDGLPHAFIVDRQNRIVWHGHTLDGLDTALEEVVGNRFDLAAARRAAGHEADINTYFTRLLASETAGARELGERLVQDPSVRPKLLNEFAWILLTHPRVPTRDLDLALSAARAAATRSGGRDPHILDTYARALNASGQTREAIEQQRKAVAATSDPTFRATLEQTLAGYQAQRP